MKQFSCNFKSRLIAAFVALASLAFVAVPAASAGTIDDIKAKGKIVIGIQAANPPWGFVDATTGNADGIDADIGKAFAKELGVKAEFAGLEVANRIPALTSGRVDVLFSTMAMLPDRAKAVQYSKPYVASTIYLVAPKSTPIKTNADMGKLTIGVLRSIRNSTPFVLRRSPACHRSLGHSCAKLP